MEMNKYRQSEDHFHADHFYEPAPPPQQPTGRRLPEEGRGGRWNQGVCILLGHKDDLIVAPIIRVGDMVLAQCPRCLSWRMTVLW